MFRQERWARIVAILEIEGSASVENLARRFDVSVDSIRKDLQALSREGRIERYYGGARRATSPSPATVRRSGQNPIRDFESTARPTTQPRPWPWNISEPTLGPISVEQEDDTTAQPAREAVARRAYLEINNGDSIFLDVSRTNLLLADLIAEGDKRVIVTTNMIEVQRRLSFLPHVTVLGTGGYLNVQVSGSMSSATQSLLEPLLMAKAFIGASGVNLTQGAVTSNSIDTGEMKERVIHNASYRFLLVEEEKFQRPGVFRFASITDFSAIITNTSNPEILAQLSRYGVPTLRSNPS
ncbi:DeoR/GlpR family DNA-binding transcription regulator [Olegusella massiliensis]|uniref:DeoR/GlpR family DNA-binding transcription regulator n=1 Tax=Olegusella massiliensis TaxID=1776381 RepID=UPI0023F8110F|nr:DeoR/GlpR family DNA-binding transcription regulator [Olegusella massiliensis]